MSIHSGQMREAGASMYIPAPPDVVFATVSDPRKPFLTANPFTRMTVVGEKTDGVGTVYRWSFTLPLGLRFQFDEVVTEWLENKRSPLCASITGSSGTGGAAGLQGIAGSQTSVRRGVLQSTEDGWRTQEEESLYATGRLGSERTPARQLGSRA